MADLLTPDVLFIGGTGRSGTNVTKAILAQHQDVLAFPFEHRLFIDPDGLIDFYRSYPTAWSPLIADRRLKRLEQFLNDMAGVGHPSGRYQGWQLGEHFPNFADHCTRLMSNLRAFDFPGTWVGSKGEHENQIYHGSPADAVALRQPIARFMNALIADALTASGKSMFVEDNTWNVLFAAELLDLVPGGKIIHIYRDPRDVIASFVKQRWCPSDLSKATQWYVELMQKWQRLRQQLPAGRVYEVKLEHLVADPTGVLRALCEFAGLSFTPGLADYDLSQAHVGRWRHDFGPAEQAELMTALTANDLLGSLGYDVT